MIRGRKVGIIIAFTVMGLAVTLARSAWADFVRADPFPDSHCRGIHWKSDGQIVCHGRGVEAYKSWVKRLIGAERTVNGDMLVYGDFRVISFHCPAGDGHDTHIYMNEDGDTVLDVVCCQAEHAADAGHDDQNGGQCIRCPEGHTIFLSGGLK